jgi:hypothetical protein
MARMESYAVCPFCDHAQTESQYNDHEEARAAFRRQLLKRLMEAVAFGLGVLWERTNHRHSTVREPAGSPDIQAARQLGVTHTTISRTLACGGAKGPRHRVPEPQAL